jgi:hypothetical protein
MPVFLRSIGSLGCKPGRVAVFSPTTGYEKYFRHYYLPFSSIIYVLQSRVAINSSSILIVRKILAFRNRKSKKHGECRECWKAVENV